MDDETKNILKQWDLSDYIDVFKDNKIDAPTLCLLNNDMIKELIKPIGDRARFTKNLDIWKQITKDDSTSTVPHVPLSVSGSVSPTSVNLSEAEQDQSTSQQESESFVDVLTEKHKNIVIPLSDLTNTQTNENTTSTSTIVYFETQQRQPLRDLLASSLEGRNLLKLYGNEGLLSNNGRRKLCNIIVKDLLFENPEVRVSHETLFSIATEIKSIFAKENISTFYVPYVNNNKIKVKTCAKGKLYDCLHNRKREYREAEKKNKSIEVKETEDKVILQKHKDDNDENEQEHLLWLQNSTEPWQIVQEKWSKSINLRLKQTADKTIAEYMSEYPALKRPTGYSLLVADFNAVYPEKENLLIEKFSLYKKKIISQAIEKAPRDASLKKIVQQLSILSEEVDDIKKNEAKSITAFMALPLLLGNPLAKAKKSNWRPSKQESSEGFITHITTAAELQATLSTRREKFKKLNVTIQPFIIIVGEDYTGINKYYVVVNDTFYVLHSIVDAVDVCFKIFHALNCRYPIECSSTWQFIQKGLYNIKTPYDKQFISVNSFMTDLGIEID